MKQLLLLAAFSFPLIGFGQNVGIGTATPAASASLDVTSTNSGVLIPRVALTATNAAGPIAAPATSLMVYNTATAGGGTATAVTPGYYYWNGSDWVRITENGWKVGTSVGTVNAIGAAGSQGFLGTTTNSHVDLVTNSVVRGRLSNLGEFFIGTTNTVVPGDMMNGVSNATFPWAINGYSSFNGSGVYGLIQTGTNTLYAAVQGEYYGSHSNGAGVRGSRATSTAGTNFANPGSGIYGGNDGDGGLGGTGAYTFGVVGYNESTHYLTGGVFGRNNNYSSGALGYAAISTFSDYSVYGFGMAFQTGAAGGKTTNAGTVGMDQTNTNIGLGIYGGVMGGWVRGLHYGFHTKGEAYSMYIDGKGYTNQPLTYLMPTNSDERVAGYMSSSMNPEVTAKGKSTMENGKVFIAFEKDFKKVISTNPEDLIITVTPQGNTNGVYVSQTTTEGFWIYENNNGRSSVQVSWMASSPIKTANTTIESELLTKDFDVKMNGLMFNENNTTENGQPLWWDGSKVRWDNPPAKKIDSESEARKLLRPKN